MITEKGFIIPTLKEIYTRKLNDFKTVKPDLRETSSNLIINYLEFDSVEEYDSYLVGLSVYNNLNVYTATNQPLNAITSHLNMTWLEAKHSIGKIKVVADIGTVIPQAWGIETKSGVKFVTLNRGELKTTKTETEIDVISLETGKFNNVRSGEITEQTEILTGIKSITNEASTLGGKDKETDTELRFRYLERVDRKTSFTTQGIRKYILENSNVVKCQVIENDTDLTDSDGRLPHSYEAICLGDTEDNIFKVLSEYKIAGIRTVGDINREINGVSIGFSRPKEIKLDFEITINAERDIWKEEYKDNIKKSIYEYIDKLEPNATVFSYVILGESYKNTNGIKTIDIKIKKSGNSTKYTDYQLKTKEIATVHDINIGVSL